MLRAPLRLLVVLLAPAWSAAQDLPTLQNGGFESPTAERLGASREQPYFALPGWRPTAGAWVAQAGTYYRVRAHEGARFLRPSRRDGDRCELTQEVSLPDRLPVAVLAQCAMRTGRGEDGTELRIDALDRTGNILSTRTTGPRGPVTWTAESLLLPLPKGCVRLRVHLIGHHRAGRITDAFFDGVSVLPFGAADPELAGLDADALLARFTAAEDTATRAATGLQLARSGSRGVAHLIRMRAAAAPEERRFLLQLLLLSKSKTATPSLREALAGASEDRAIVLGGLHLLQFDWRKELVALVRRNPAERLGCLAALAHGGGFANLAAMYTRGDKDLRLDILKALVGATYTAAAVRTIVTPGLSGSADEDLRSASMKVLARAKGPRYLRVLGTVCRAESRLGMRAAYVRWATERNTLAAVQALLPLVAKDMPRIRSAFLESVPRMTAEDVSDWLRDAGLRHALPVVQRTALAHMRRHPRSGDPDLLAGLLLRGNAPTRPPPEIAFAAIEALSQHQGEAPAKILTTLSRRGAPRVAAAALRALGQPGLAAELARDARSWRVRAAAIDVLATDACAQRALLTAACEAPQRPVRIAAYLALARCREVASIETLLRRLGHERSTALAFLTEALADLTGTDKGLDPEDWRPWWQAVRDGFKVPPRRTKTAARNRPRPNATVATFYDLPVEADHVVFLVDLSGSMRDAVGTGGQTKLAAAGQQLVRVLESMAGPNRSFNILAFGDAPIPYASELVRASEENIRKATRWVQRLKAKGWTNIHDSLVRALDMPGVESIFLLSDGAPSVGELVDMDAVRRAIRRRNAGLRIRIHTISIGNDTRARAFMRRLAEENHGKNRDRK